MALDSRELPTTEQKNKISAGGHGRDCVQKSNLLFGSPAVKAESHFQRGGNRVHKRIHQFPGELEVK